jgi:hypothetical protein
VRTKIPARPKQSELLSVLEGLLPSLAALLFLLRFGGLSYAPFIQDEPYLQILLDQHLGAGTLPTFGVEGSFGLPYGPTALWFYYPIRLFTHSPYWLIAAHAGLVACAFLLFYLALAKAVGKAEAGWAALLASSSPFLFFYSRIAWDNTFLIFGSALLLFALGALEKTPRPSRWALLGLAGGLLLNTHLMSLPLLASALLAALPALKKAKKRGFAVGALSGAFLLPVSFYLYGLTIAPRETLEPSPGRGELFDLLAGLLLGFGRFLSSAGFDYFLGAGFEPVHSIGRWPDYLSAFDPGWLLKAAAGAAAIATAWRARAMALPALLKVGLLAPLLSLPLYLALGPAAIHPHYLMALWWLGFLFCAQALRLASGRKQALLKLLVGVVAAANLAYVAGFSASMRERMGTRNMRYGTGQAELEETARELCRRMGREGASAAELHLRATPGVRPAAMAYLSRHEPECEGKKLVFMAGFPGAVKYKLVYANSVPGDARLLIEAVKE